jgi:hypothetical protein
MGGEIGVDSIPGLGSSFWFTLDLIEATEHTDKTDITQGEESWESLRSLNVLLAEDTH